MARQTAVEGVVVPGWRSAAHSPFPELPDAPYAPIAVRNGGRVRVEVELSGAAPVERAAPDEGEDGPCGAEARRIAAESALERDGSRLANVVLWLADIRSGKRLPLERRYELTNASCQLEPRVQAVIAGGTVNVRSADAVSHRTHFHRARTGESLVLVALEDPGSVVPVETVLARTGMIEVRCDVHPWTRAWIAVFDHPYFAVTSRGGAVTLDDVPPGQYRLLAWHERLGLQERHLLVEAGRETRVALRLRAPGGAR